MNTWRVARRVGTGQKHLVSHDPSSQAEVSMGGGVPKQKGETTFPERCSVPRNEVSHVDMAIRLHGRIGRQVGREPDLATSDAAQGPSTCVRSDLKRSIADPTQRSRMQAETTAGDDG